MMTEQRMRALIKMRLEAKMKDKTEFEAVITGAEPHSNFAGYCMGYILSTDNELEFLEDVLNEMDGGSHEEPTEEALEKYWDAIVMMMDDELREKVHGQYAPCSKEKFLREYKTEHYIKYREEFKI